MLKQWPAQNYIKKIAHIPVTEDKRDDVCFQRPNIILDKIWIKIIDSSAVETASADTRWNHKEAAV